MISSAAIPVPPPIWASIPTIASLRISQSAIAGESKAFADFRARVSAIDPATLSLEAQLDREQLLHAFDAAILRIDVIRLWTKDPDSTAAA